MTGTSSGTASCAARATACMSSVDAAKITTNDVGRPPIADWIASTVATAESVSEEDPTFTQRATASLAKIVCTSDLSAEELTVLAVRAAGRTARGRAVARPCQARFAMPAMSSDCPAGGITAGVITAAVP
jgi:hypothetical protein